MPTYVTKVTNAAGDQLTITFDQAVDGSTGITLKVNGSSQAFSITGSNGTSHRVLTPTNYIFKPADVITFDYTAGDITATTGGAALANSTGNSVTNNSSAFSLNPPIINSAGNSITINAPYSLTVGGSGFTVTANGSPVTISSYTLAAGSVTLALGSSVTHLQNVVVTYTPGDFRSSLYFAYNNSWNVPYLTGAPTTNAGGTTVTVNFAAAVDGTAGFTLKVGGVSKAFTVSGTNGTSQRVLTLSSYTITGSDTVTLDYTGTSIYSTVGGTSPKPFSGQAVTNNVGGANNAKKLSFSFGLHF